MTEQTKQPDEAQPGGRTIVIGGGLAGIAAAVQLARQGVAVTLLETRKRLGGRATSFVDPSSGHVLDNCQHVLMGCCTNLIDLYRKLGVENCIEWHRRLYFCGPQSKGGFLSDRGKAPWIIDELEADDLPAPLHMSQAMMAFRTLSLAEKLGIAQGMLAIMRTGREGRQRVANQTFYDWLLDHHQLQGAIDKYWSVVVISALNELPEHCSAAYALQVFQEGFLANEKAYIMGLASVPLVRLYDPAEKVITQAGGTVRYGAGVSELIYEPHVEGDEPLPGRVTAVRLNSGEVIEGDRFISTVPFDRLKKICGDELLQADSRLHRLDRMTVSPIIGVHLWFASDDGKPVMHLPHVILMNSPLQWIFNKGMDTPRDAGFEGELPANMQGLEQVNHLHGVISAAHDLVEKPAEEIIALVAGEVRKAIGSAADARLVHGRVVKEKRATFSVRPGVDRLRPPARGAVDNLYLAGDWVDTGWPATMEGAVRSGYIAAGGALEDMGVVGEELVADLATSPLYQFVAG